VWWREGRGRGDGSNNYGTFKREADVHVEGSDGAPVCVELGREPF